MGLNKTTLVICFSTESIKADIWTNKQHLMSRLSRREEYDIIYVDQGMSTREFMNAINKRDWNYFFKPVWKFNEKLTCISFYFLPLIKGGGIKKVSWQLLYSFLQIWIDKKKYQRIIIWTYQPQSWYYINKLDQESGNVLILYDCVDDFKSQPFYKNSHKRKEELLEIESKLVQKADAVTTTSLKLYEDKKKLNENTYYIHNVGDFEHFNAATHSLPKDLSFLYSIRKKKIVYAGVVDDYKIDLELIDRVTDLEELYFLFLGPIRVQDKLKLFKKIENKKNVLFYGYLDYNILPSVLHACDTIWLPYQKNKHTQYVFPLKLFEAFATGKQVVARALKSYEKYSSYMQIFEDSEQAVKKLLKIKDEQAAKERINLAKKNSWDSRLNKMLGIVDKLHKQ